MRRIVVLVHRYHLLDTWPYFMTEIAGVWREQGIEVIVARGPQQRVDADVAIMHVDLTITPEDHVDFIRQYPKTINGSVTDVTKRRVSRHLVSRNDGYDGPVIIKSDLNFGGFREFQLAAMGLHPPCKFFKPTDYLIFDSPKKVPPTVWDDREIVVEQFLSERQGDLYCLRTWVFLGDKETNSLSFSKEPVVKSATVIRREVVPEVPDDLRQMRRDLGFDYGKFDYAIVDGKVVLYDANRTPGLGKFSREQFMPRIRHLAEGIKAFE